MDIEPFQSCADMLKRGVSLIPYFRIFHSALTLTSELPPSIMTGFEIGLSTGDTQVSLINGIHFLQKSLLSGTELKTLKKECDYQLRLAEAHSQSMSKVCSPF